jgi:hypothetical protein
MLNCCFVADSIREALMGLRLCLHGESRQKETYQSSQTLLSFIKTLLPFNISVNVPDEAQ